MDVQGGIDDHEDSELQHQEDEEFEIQDDYQISEEQYEEEDDDQMSGNQCLPVEQPANFDPTRPPQDGFDYLYRVHLEAKNCPRVIRASPPFKAKKSNLSKENGSSNSHSQDSIGESEAKRPRRSMSSSDYPAIGVEFVNLAPDSNLKIPIDVQKEQIEDFARLKKKIARKRAQMNEHSQDFNGEQNTKILDTDKSIEYSQLLTLSQSDICHNLELLTKEMLEENSTSKDQQIKIKGSWLYSLLALLEEPLESSIYATLRQISRICSFLRHQQNCQQDTWTACNLVILIISDYYQQKDLKD